MLERADSTQWVKEEFSEAIFNCPAQHNIFDPVTRSLIAMNLLSQPFNVLMSSKHSAEIT